MTASDRHGVALALGLLLAAAGSARADVVRLRITPEHSALTFKAARSLVAGGAFARGSVFTDDGLLVAPVTREGLSRTRRKGAATFHIATRAAPPARSLDRSGRA